jgi:hypothetical protein
MITDPIKELNNERYFNSVALKSRYQLLNLNQQNEKAGFESGSHWVKYMPYPFFDKDIKYNKYILAKNSIKELNSENSNIFNEINKKKIVSYLDNMDQTNTLSDEIMKIKQIPKKDYYFTKSQKFEKKLKKEENSYFEKLKNKMRNLPIKLNDEKESQNININQLNTENNIIDNHLYSNNSEIEQKNNLTDNNNNNHNYIRLRKNSKSQKFTIHVRNLDSFNDKNNSLNIGNFSPNKKIFHTQLNCLKPNKLPKMSLIKINLLPKFISNQNSEEEKGKNKGKNKLIDKIINKKNNINLINIEFSNELESNIN